MKFCPALRSRLLLVGLAASLGAAPLAAETLSALGRVLPRTGVLDLAGTPGDLVEKIAVAEGDWAEPGQVLVRLSSASAAGKQLAAAEADLAAARRSTAAEIALARDHVALVEAQAKIADERLTRMVAAAKNSEFISPDQIEDRKVGLQTARNLVATARHDLDKALRAADKSVRAAEAEVEAARTRLARAEIRAPARLRVLKSRIHEGGQAPAQWLLKLGDTSRMIVVAEIYEADILKVKPGQKVTVGSAALPKKMTGRVESVAGIIYPNSLEGLDPNESSRSRIVDVRIAMDESSPLDRLVLLQVDVVIDL